MARVWLLTTNKSNPTKKYLVDDREDPGLTVLSAVGTNTEVDFLGVGIGLVGGSQGENDISGCASNVLKDRSYSYNSGIFCCPESA